MIHSDSSSSFGILSVILLPEGRYGTRDTSYALRAQLDRSAAVADGFDRRAPQLLDHQDVPPRRHHRPGCRAIGLWRGDHHTQSSRVSRARHRGRQAAKTSWSPKPGDHGFRCCHGRDRRFQSSRSGLWLLHVVDQTVGGTFEEDHRDLLQGGSIESAAASSWIFGSASQARDEGQKRRGGLPAGCRGTRRLETKAIRTNADDVLIYEDEVEIHRHPTLTRMWAAVETQPEVPAGTEREGRYLRRCRLRHWRHHVHDCSNEIGSERPRIPGGIGSSLSWS